MNINQYRKQIAEIEARLQEMQLLARIDDARFVSVEAGKSPEFSGTENMRDCAPEESNKLHEMGADIEKMLPPGFSVDGTLLRHLSFNQSRDWVDIAKSDIPYELKKLQEYRNKLVLIEYLEALHPAVARASGIVLSGDLDAALKVVFAAFDVRVREVLKLRPGVSTMPEIGRAFKDGTLVSPIPENEEGVRNFLQGVTGYYRNYISHNNLPASRNRIEASLSLFALAHEAFVLLDRCIPPDAS